jgi:Ca2+/Na+ antiporter
MVRLVVIIIIISIIINNYIDLYILFWVVFCVFYYYYRVPCSNSYNRRTSRNQSSGAHGPPNFPPTSASLVVGESECPEENNYPVFIIIPLNTPKRLVNLVKRYIFSILLLVFLVSSLFVSLN